MLLGYRVLHRMPHSVFRRLMRLRAGRFTVGLVCVVSWRGRLLFVEQRYRTGWSMPGGGITPGELPEHGAARELREEVGLDAPLTYVTHAVENSAKVQNVMFIYTAEYADHETPPIEPGIEIARIRWAQPEEIWPDLHREIKKVLTALGRAPTSTATPAS
jgi:8-oxo-dGTP pyrophosphatase MutT (NUDIX family)